jgi:hypothetical protein
MRQENRVVARIPEEPEAGYCPAHDDASRNFGPNDSVWK